MKPFFVFRGKDDPDPSPLIDEHEVARRADVSVLTVRKWRQRRTGPRFVKCGYWVRYHLFDLELWLQCHNPVKARKH